jgi:hypothetical protein
MVLRALLNESMNSHAKERANNEIKPIDFNELFDIISKLKVN